MESTERHPLVSVIMAAYNAEKYIRASIKSLLDQSYPYWELLVVNDGSKDGTGDIIQAYSDKRIRYFYKANGGVSSARNIGLKNMRGNFFCFLDADDLLPPRSLELRVQFMQRHEHIDLLDGEVRVLDENLEKTIREYHPSFSGEVATQYIRLNPKVFFGINVFIRNRGISYWFREGMTHAEDLWFYTELAWNHRLKYDHLDECIYWCRTTGGSAMSNLPLLEAGYWNFYHLAEQLQGISVPQLRYLRIRITRIMFLSYLASRHWYLAAKVLFLFFKKI